jgi:hypothetical protein
VLAALHPFSPECLPMFARFCARGSHESMAPTSMRKGRPGDIAFTQKFKKIHDTVASAPWGWVPT